MDHHTSDSEPNFPSASENIRLVIWDLDETFWNGTLTEGGIEYIDAHHEIVVELAGRGIMSSICSKNDFESVKKILVERNLWDYFIFPSINWEPKGKRLAELVEKVQLRAPTILFIDDNALNRNEATHFVPGLQVSDETSISLLLSSPLCKGKDDRDLSRLKQYKLLEMRTSDQQKSSSDSSEFLQGCDIRVYIEYDILPYIDRAIELINRTNQLNFTKVRLPEDICEARKSLTKLVDDHSVQSGLVRVIDKYGDYGFVGVFVVRNGAVDASRQRLLQVLVHYCFSCRTLGMFVEQWLYEWLQRPQIKVVGEVLTDLNVPRQIDWIRMISSVNVDAGTIVKLAPEIRVHGGCEAASVAHYLAGSFEKVVVTGNFHAGTHFVRMNSASLLLSACDRATPDFEREAEALHIPYGMLVSRFFDDAPEGTVFVFGGQYDAPGPHRYRHRLKGWEIKIEAHGLPTENAAVLDWEELAQRIENLPFNQAAKHEIAEVARHVNKNYQSASFPDDETLVKLMRTIFDRIPVGSKLILVVDDHRFRDNDGVIQNAPWVKEYSRKISALSSPYPFVSVVSFADVIQNDAEILIGGNHYNRMVYYRLADNIISETKRLTAKAPPARCHGSQAIKSLGNGDDPE